jgi:hypothetical protein
MKELAMVRVDRRFKYVRQLGEECGQAAAGKRPRRGLATLDFAGVQDYAGSKGGGPLVGGCVHVSKSFIQSIC